MYSVDKRGISKQGVLSLIVTLSVIGILVFSASAQAVTINFKDRSTHNPQELSTATFHMDISFANDEIVPIQYFTLFLGADSCKFNPDGTEISGTLCNKITIQNVATPQQEFGNLFGRGKDPQGNPASISFGYGYGYAGTDFDFLIEWTTPHVVVDTKVDARLDAFAENDDVSFTFSKSENNFFMVRPVKLSKEGQYSVNYPVQLNNVDQLFNVGSLTLARGRINAYLTDDRGLQTNGMLDLQAYDNALNQYRVTLDWSNTKGGFGAELVEDTATQTIIRAKARMIWQRSVQYNVPIIVTYHKDTKQIDVTGDGFSFLGMQSDQICKRVGGRTICQVR